MFFWCLFSGIGSQTGPEMWWKVSLCDHPGDAMLQYVVIFSNLVFERPYSVLATFSNVSWARGAKKRSTKTLETYLAALCEKNTLRHIKNHKKIKKTTPIEDQMGAPAAPWLVSFWPTCLWRGHPGAKISKTRSMFGRGVPKPTKMMFIAPKIKVKVSNGGLSSKIYNIWRNINVPQHMYKKSVTSLLHRLL